ncbi:MAG: hypothetical protein IH921_04435, partial [Gemmatimonadetes bacterium]|nr:hypothetical protein [Gemmatimonadota bacterium]
VTAAAAAVLFGPVLAHADVIERRIASGNDDAEEDLGNASMDLGSSDLELINDGGPQSVGMRFTNIDIPPGSIIQSAFIQFTVDEMDSGPTSLTVSGELSPDAAAFSSNAGDITSRPLTATFVEWNDLPPWNTIGEAVEIFQGGNFDTPHPASGPPTEDACIVVKLIGITDVGGVVVVDVRKSDVLSLHPTRN